MSRKSQAKRAAKAKDRAKQRARSEQRSAGNDSRHSDDAGTTFSSRHGAPAEDESGGFPFRSVPDGVSQARYEIEQVWYSAMNGGVPPKEAARRLSRLPRSQVMEINEHYLRRDLARVYAAGWSPVELVRQMQLLAGTGVATLARWLVSADHVHRDAERISRRWRAEIDETLVAVFARSGWLQMYADAVEIDWVEACELVFVVERVFAQLPQVDVLIQPPSGITPWSAVVGHLESGSDPVLNQIRALLAKAESTDHEAEAFAFTAKAQELMTKHAIDHAVLDTGRRDPEQPSMIRIPVDAPYADAKATLLHAVATHSRCRTVYSRALKHSSVAGYPSDLDVVDLIFASLLVQVQNAMRDDARGSVAGGRKRSQGYRAAFLQGFTDRIYLRLSEANAEVYAADDRSKDYLPVLRSREEKVSDFIHERFGDLHTFSARGGYDSLGYAGGQLAGDIAEFGAGSVRAAPERLTG